VISVDTKKKEMVGEYVCEKTGGVVGSGLTLATTGR